MPRILLHCLLILALAAAGTALPRHAHGQEASHGPHAHAVAGGAGHAGHTGGSKAAADVDCCADTGCDCGCAVAPAVPAPGGAIVRLATPAAPLERLAVAGPSPRARPPLRPPAA